MKIAICGDVHISKTSSIVTSRGKKYTRRLESCIDTLNWFETVSKDNNCELEIFLGDVFDTPNVDAEIITAINDIKWNNISKRFICGNHEMGSNDLIFNSLNILSHIGKVIIEPEIENINESNLFYLPYILESNRKPMSYYKTQAYDKLNNSTINNKNTIMFSHNDIKGLQYGKMISKIGFDIQEYKDNADIIINGHLHNQCQINENIINIGNITGQSFNEDAEKYSHTMGILDTETLKLELINNPYALNFYKFELFNLEDVKLCLNKCKDNSVISVKTYDKYIENIKEEILSNKNIIAYKFSIKPIIVEKEEDAFKDIVKTNYEDQFADCMIEKLGDSEIVKDELLKLLNHLTK